MFNKIYNKFLNLKVVKKFITFQKKIILPGFDGLPFFEVIVFFIKGIQKGSLTSRAAATAFNFFLAIFPAILFFFTIIPYLPIENFQEILMSLLNDILPKSAYETVSSTIEDIILRKRGSLLSIGFIMALYFSTSGIRSLIVAFNNTYHSIEKRSTVKIYLISLLLVIVLSIIVIIAITIIVIGTDILEFLVAKELIKGYFSYFLIQFTKWIIIIAMVFFIISFMYFLAPAKVQRFRFFSAGSTLATALSILTSLGFDFYVANFSRYNALYGSIGTLIVIMLWIYFNALILLIGFELNASIQSAGIQSSINKLKKKNKMEKKLD